MAAPLESVALPKMTLVAVWAIAPGLNANRRTHVRRRQVTVNTSPKENQAPCDWLFARIIYRNASRHITLFVPESRAGSVPGGPFRGRAGGDWAPVAIDPC